MFSLKSSFFCSVNKIINTNCVRVRIRARIRVSVYVYVCVPACIHPEFSLFIKDQTCYTPKAPQCPHILWYLTFTEHYHAQSKTSLCAKYCALKLPPMLRSPRSSHFPPSLYKLHGISIKCINLRIWEVKLMHTGIDVL